MNRYALTLLACVIVSPAAIAGSSPSGDFNDAIAPTASLSGSAVTAESLAQDGIWSRSGDEPPAPDMSVDPELACGLLHAELARPRMRSETIVLGSYTDVLTLPQTRTECTHVYDTGVPDLATCTTVYDGCASEWHGPFGTRGCIPGTTTNCDNIKACDTYRHESKTMECDLTLQLKLPNFIERPMEDFIDETYNIADAARNELAGALPLECAGDIGNRSLDGDRGQAIADAITAEVSRRIRERVEEEARAWLTETAITAVIAAIPTGGVGGAAALATELATFIHRVETRIKPIVKFVRDTQGLAEDMGFGTSCGWSDWHAL